MFPGKKKPTEQLTVTGGGGICYILVLVFFHISHDHKSQTVRDRAGYHTHGATLAHTHTHTHQHV